MADSSLQSRLDSVSNSQENIQSLSLWLLHHKKHHKNIADHWQKAIVRAKPSHRLTLLYLANDVIQNARKKSIKEYLESFQLVLPHIMQLLSDTTIRKNVLRVLDIWIQRNIYPKDFIESLKNQLSNDVAATASKKIPESALTTQIVAEFQLNPLINLIRQLESIENETSLKCDGLTNVRLNVVTSEILSHLKDKTLGDHLLKEADEAKKALESAIEGLENEVEFRKKLVESLSKALVYYVVKQDEVNHEFKAYINIGQNVASVMQEFNKPTTIIPPADAPSPTDSDDGPILPSTSIPQTSSLDKRLETILHGIIQDGRRHAQNTTGQQMVQSYESHLLNQPYDPGSFSNSPHDSSFVRPIPAVVSSRDSKQGHNMSSHYDSFPPIESCEPSDMDITNSDDEEYSPTARVPSSSTLRVIEPHPYQGSNLQSDIYSIQPPIHHQQPSQYASRGHRERHDWSSRNNNNARSHPSSSGSYNWRPHKGRHGGGGGGGHGGRQHQHQHQQQQQRNDFRHH